MKVLLFSIDHTQYALNIESILQVIRENRVVDMPYETTWFTGIIPYKDMMIPVLNLNQLKDRTEISSKDHLRRTIVLSVKEHWVGLAVDQTYGVVSIDEDIIEDFAHVGDRPVYMTGAFHYGDTLTFMMEPEKFFSEAFNQEMNKVKSFHEENAGSRPHESIH